MSAEDISATLLFNRAPSNDIAVCGGGHMTNGSSSTYGGLVINLRKIRKVTVNAEEKIIFVQEGHSGKMSTKPLQSSVSQLWEVLSTTLEWED